jgi:hypothetical protein
MFHVAIGSYQVQLHYDRLPTAYGEYKKRAALLEEFGVWSKSGACATDADGTLCCVSVSKGTDWPFLLVTQRYTPSGFFPGVVLLEETSRLFIGAGDRILCYDLSGPSRIWEDTADTGFWSWCRHGDVIVMSAELELAAWDLHGRKLWSTFVEPPWKYAVDKDDIHLDVMGTESVFPLREGR